MADKQTGKSSHRTRSLVQTGSVIRRLSGFFKRELHLEFSLIGLFFALALSLVVVGFQLFKVPEYQPGDTADRTVESPLDFTILDEQATESKKQESLRAVPAVFDLDLRRNSRVESELRSGFGHGRRLVEEARKGLRESQSLPPDRQRALVEEVRVALPSFDQEDVLEILLRHRFSSELEDQMINLLQQALKYPGVISSREALFLYRDRGVVLFNTVTQQDDPLQDWMTIRDLEEARDILRQNAFELIALTDQEKPAFIRFLDHWVIPNVQFNEVETRAREEVAMENVDPVLLQIKKGRTIVRSGDEVTPLEAKILSELRRENQAGHFLERYAGSFLLIGFFLFVGWKYLLAMDERELKSRFVLFGLLLLFGLALTKGLVVLAETVAESVTLESFQSPLNLYFTIPFAAGTVLAVLLFNADFAILYVVTYGVLVGMMTGELEIVVFALAGCLTSAYMLRQYRERSAFVKAGLVIGLVNVMVVLALLWFTASFDWASLLVRTVGAFLSGLLSVMVVSLFLPILESLFGVTTDVRLLELSNLNSPILRRLAVEAPGTYHHSIIVGTLAEAAAEAIGANSLLVRAGAYYHDIGKLRKPEYYVENQIYMGNKHDNLSPSMSSLILASHVKDGLALARDIKLAPKVRDLIPEHHGTKLMTFFYQKAKQGAEGRNIDVNEEDFRYPGPKPQSREAAILMLADQVEAASRTLQEPTPGQIRSLIRRLIQGTIEDRQFDECDITTRDLDQITRAFERVITGMYHHRVEYPGFDFNKQVGQRRSESQRIQ